MSLKTERAINEAITTLHASKWDKLKRFGRKSLLTAVSAISIASGMMGTSMQMQAHEPESYTTVRLEDLDAYLKGQKTQQATQKQQQYAEIYANRDAYRYQQQANQWYPLEIEDAYVGTRIINTPYGKQRIPVTLYDNLNIDKYEGVLYTNGEKVLYKSIALGTPDKVLDFQTAAEAAMHPGGDTAELYCHPDNAPRHIHYRPPSNASTAEKVIRTVDAAARTAHTILHIVKGHRR